MEQEPASQETSRPQFVEVLDVAAKIAVAAIAIVYLVGYVTTTCYLSRFGLPASDLLQPQYITAGLWTLVPLVLIGATYAAGNLEIPVFRALKLHGQERPIAKVCKRFAQAAIPLVVFEGIGLFLLINFTWAAASIGPRFSKPSFSTAALAFVVTVISLTICVSLEIGLARSLRKYLSESNDSEQRSLHLSRTVLCALGCLVFFFGYVSFFATYIFGHIPSQVGGGKPILVQFILKEVSASEPDQGAATQPAAAEPYLTPGHAGGNWSHPQLLFKATDEDYAVYNAEVDGAVIFPRELVDGYVIVREK